jgi:hypothetical protein
VILQGDLKSDLADESYIGTLSQHRVDSIIAGVSAFLQPVRPRR